jgi:hypothetical protein
MEFIRSTIVNRYAPAGDETVTFDLPVNPVSMIAVTVFADQTAAGNLTDPLNLASMVTNCEILYRESAVVSGPLDELAAAFRALTGKNVVQGQILLAENNVSWVTVPIIFGRMLFNPEESFFATKRGELKIRLTLDVATTDFDGLEISVETVEIPGSQPKKHLRYNRLVFTPPATGEHDVDISQNGHLIGTLFRSTTVPDDDAWTSSLDYIEFMLNNLEKYYTRNPWEMLHSWFCMKNPTHYDQAVLDANGYWDQATYEQYGYMDLDHNADLMFAPDLTQFNRAHFRINAGDTNAIKIYPIELVTGGALVP